MSKTMATPAASPLAGRRILLVGPNLALAVGELLKGAATESAALERLPQAFAGAYDLVLVDADAWEAQALAGAVEALAATDRAAPVLLIGERLPTTVVRPLMRLTSSDVLEAPFSADQLAGAATALLASAQPAPTPSAPEGGSRCWAVSGAVGGAGATTIAVEIATALAARSGKDRSVCLVDLNLVDGAAAAYLGAQPNMRLGDFTGAAERIDAALLQAFVSPISKQLDLLASPRDPEAFDTVSREAVLRMLEVACECYEWVIIDMPRHRRTWTLEALSGCDEVLVISELTVPALIAARSLAEEIETAVNGPAKPRIVLNRLASRMFGPAPSMAEAERALQRKSDGGISSDWEAAAAAANLGGAIAQHRPKSKIVKDIAQLVDRFAAAARQPGAASQRAA
ncbi:AAA family ATPase [Phenylobacterium sp. LjRoot219]|uniref:AAA family ATPase n=1 Tax=Phenylobacterium sp. LjRoot219 TaxID=3342283 RepID=UPI003ED0850F